MAQGSNNYHLKEIHALRAKIIWIRTDGRRTNFDFIQTVK